MTIKANMSGPLPDAAVARYPMRSQPCASCGKRSCGGECAWPEDGDYDDVGRSENPQYASDHFGPAS